MESYIQGGLEYSPSELGSTVVVGGTEYQMYDGIKASLRELFIDWHSFN
jgi:hypothetical protein